MPKSAHFLAFFAALLVSARVCEGQPTIRVAVTNPTCAYNNGGFVVTAAGGTPPYSFVSNAARESNSNGIFSGLAAGTYDLTVRDIKGKTVIDSVKLTSPGTFPYFTAAVVNSTGCNTNNGQVTLTPAGGTPPYQYSINDGASFQSSNVFSNLLPGTYSILIEDANGCITAPWSAVGVSYADFQVWSHASFVHVTAPNCALAISATPSAPACGNNNTITVNNTSGGTPPYLYSIDGGAMGPLPGGGFSGLSPGEHMVTVQDAAGLRASYTYTFPNDCAITTTQTPSQCGVNTGTLTVTGASGIPPLSYSIDGTNFQASPTFSGLAKGSYTIVVKDAHGVVTYGMGNVVAVCYAAVAASTASQCNVSTGSISAKGVNGFTPYMFSLDGVHFQASGNFSNLKGGYYTVTVKDSHGQIAKTTVVVEDQCINLAATAQTASCSNPNGSITVTASNGTAPYLYSLSAGNFYQASNQFLGLPTGFWTVTVKDANGNIATTGVMIPNIQGPQVSAIPTTASCINNDGAVQIIITGGASPFQTTFQGVAGASGQTNWTGLSQGTYSVDVTDNNGCQDSTVVLVPLTDTLAISAAAVPATCQGVGVMLPVSSTSNGVSYAWTPASGLSNVNVADPIATPAFTTSYIVTATAGVCTKSDTVLVTVMPAPVASAGAADTLCSGKSVQLQGSGGVQYSWSPGIYLSDSTSANPTVDQPVSTVTYHLKVRDANGCSSLDSAATTVVVSPAPKVFAGNDTTVVIGQPLQLNAVDVDSSGFTSYAWSPAQGLSNADIADPTTVVTGSVTYSVTATTPAGCIATDTIAVEAATLADIIVPNAFTPNHDGHNDLLRVIGYGIQSLTYFRVYDRWGRLMFAASEVDAGWDGSVGGQPAPTGTYVWMAAGWDYQGKPVERKGTSILIR